MIQDGPCGEIGIPNQRDESIRTFISLQDEYKAGDTEHRGGNSTRVIFRNPSDLGVSRYPYLSMGYEFGVRKSQTISNSIPRHLDECRGSGKQSTHSHQQSR